MGGVGCIEWMVCVVLVFILDGGDSQQIVSIHNINKVGCIFSDKKIWIYQQFLFGEWMEVIVDIMVVLVDVNSVILVSFKLVEVGSNGYGFEIEFDDVMLVHML